MQDGGVHGAAGAADEGFVVAGGDSVWGPDGRCGDVDGGG